MILHEDFYPLTELVSNVVGDEELLDKLHYRYGPYLRTVMQDMDISYNFSLKLNPNLTVYEFIDRYIKEKCDHNLADKILSEDYDQASKDEMRGLLKRLHDISVVDKNNAWADRFIILTILIWMAIVAVCI